MVGDESWYGRLGVIACRWRIQIPILNSRILNSCTTPYRCLTSRRYGDAVSDDRVCLALPRLCDPDPVAPAFGGLRLLGHLSILFPLTLILDILPDFTYLGSSISCLTECRSSVQQGEDSIAR
ncbi:hypothetical protein Syun_011675 [Stephania yunnanensis]|uniref:Uncharacterized protein n=1 Tax=Stephania yunnanensis TaxID=152371 RepID=A0AAP0K077_9MAGN